AAIAASSVAPAAMVAPCALLSRPLDEEIRALEAHAARVSACGAQTLVVTETTRSIEREVTPLSRRPWIADREWPAFGRALTELAGCAAARGVTFAYRPRAGGVIADHD